MTFTTASGSVYEIDARRKLARRLFGKQLATDRLGEAWQPFVDMSDVVEGQPVLFEWPDTVPLLPGSPGDANPATLTTCVVSIDCGGVC